jgi:hypothetical protein
VYAFVEARDGDALSAEARHALAVEVVGQLQAQLGFRPGRVYLLRPRSLPVTSNGKLRHAELRAQYLTGELRRQGAILYPDF